MQYLLRFILASYVVAFHMGSYYFPNAGPFAVFGFYTLSGFLITKVLNEVYYRKTEPARDFFTNRFWRLYPTFFVAMLFGAALAFSVPDVAVEWNRVIRLPTGPDELGWTLANVSIFGLHLGGPISSPIRFAPPSWTTAIEVYFYIFLFAVGARSMRTARVWSIVSALMLGAIALYTLFSPAPIYDVAQLMYGTVFGVSLCFALGALTYFAGKEAKKHHDAIGLLAFVGAVLLPLVPWRILIPSDLAIMLLHYAESLLVAGFLLYLSNSSLGRWATWLGDLSYPLFLIHWQVAILLAALGTGVVKNNVASIVIIYGAAVLISCILVLLIERPLQGIRRRVRERNAPPKEESAGQRPALS